MYVFIITPHHFTFTYDILIRAGTIHFSRFYRANYTHDTLPTQVSDMPIITILL